MMSVHVDGTKVRVKWTFCNCYYYHGRSYSLLDLRDSPLPQKLFVQFACSHPCLLHILSSPLALLEPCSILLPALKYSSTSELYILDLFQVPSMNFSNQFLSFLCNIVTIFMIAFRILDLVSSFTVVFPCTSKCAKTSHGDFSLNTFGKPSTNTIFSLSSSLSRSLSCSKAFLCSKTSLVSKWQLTKDIVLLVTLVVHWNSIRETH